jgi:hypothetical protein
MDEQIPTWAIELIKQVERLNEKIPTHIDWVERNLKDHERRLRFLEKMVWLAAGASGFIAAISAAVFACLSASRCARSAGVVLVFLAAMSMPAAVYFAAVRFTLGLRLTGSDCVITKRLMPTAAPTADRIARGEMSVTRDWIAAKS